ncbi:unnamed protein product [Adineta ricciae]|uniref:Uncharacterized protein n=1 Tax=Adineta ricciae TaxID=249248 RepID=A0A813U176_ADIRI|nr:unnamed protein product [Adineta ricciae]CAF1425347.1 unnamed protein product [Adineta ricciae]
MDIDIIVHEDDFERAKTILIEIGYKKVIGDGLCIRFQHEAFLPIDVLSSLVFGDHPTESNSIESDADIKFCTLPILVLTKLKPRKSMFRIRRIPVGSDKILYWIRVWDCSTWGAHIGRPCTKAAIAKKKMDNANICNLILIHDLDVHYAKNNNFDCITQHVYEKYYQNLYEEINFDHREKKEKKQVYMPIEVK